MRRLIYLVGRFFSLLCKIHANGLVRHAGSSGLSLVLPAEYTQSTTYRKNKKTRPTESAAMLTPSKTYSNRRRPACGLAILLLRFFITISFTA
jgi:hypothetical protein